MPLSYNEVRKLILQTLEERPGGTKVQVPNQQNYELALLDYVQQLETSMSTSIVGIADSTTDPIEPPSARVAYLSQAGVNTTVTFKNFVDASLDPIEVTTDADHVAFITLFWNTNYWQAQAVMIPVINDGGGSGTTDYNELENLPSIDGVMIKGELSAAMLGLLSTGQQTLTQEQQQQFFQNLGWKVYVSTAAELVNTTGLADGVITALIDCQALLFTDTGMMLLKGQSDNKNLYFLTLNHNNSIRELRFNLADKKSYAIQTLPLRDGGAVRYDEPQNSLTETQQAQARTNIKAAAADTSVQSKTVKGVEITEHAPAAQDNILYIEVKPDTDGQ